MTAAFPGSMLCQKLPIAKYISAMIFVWGGITMLTATVKSYEGLLAQRYDIRTSGPAKVASHH